VKILELVSQREQVAAEIGLVKEKDGLGVRDRARERKVKADFTRMAKAADVDPGFSEVLADILISRAVRVQLAKRRKDLDGKTALVVGGSGKMGAWFCRRLSNRGAKVQVWDPRGNLDGYENINRLTPAARVADIVIISSPLGACPDGLREVLDTRPRGLVFDVCSVKSHIAGQLRRAASSGIKITSVHPMFGPNAATPKGRNVIVCDCGCAQANGAARSLFSSAGANVVNISLEKHDELMAYVLGLSHATTLMFATALARSGKNMKDLVSVQGPSFDRMLTSAKELSRESVRVYHDIQALNSNTRRMFSNLEKALGNTQRASMDKNPKEFRKIIESNKKYLEVD
jgi:chorismate mutase/prephenate dehydrogenase